MKLIYTEAYTIIFIDENGELQWRKEEYYNLFNNVMVSEKDKKEFRAFAEFAKQGTMIKINNIIVFKPN